MMPVDLRIHDCLTGTSPSKNAASPNRPSPSVRRSNHTDSKSALVVKVPAKKLVMEQVKILKRGEDLNPEFKTAAKERKTPLKMKKKEKGQHHHRSGQENEKVKNTDEESKLFSTNRFGPEPDKVPKQIHLADLKSVGGEVVDKFAGSAAITSPSPSSLPLPSFFMKKDVSLSSSSSSSNSAAAEYLRSMLGLNLV